MRSQELYLADILEAIANINDFVGAMSLAEFEEDRKTCSAVIHQFQIIGEAVKHISEELIIQHPQISWKDIAGMRNILVHEYFGVDLNLVYETIQHDLPQLKKTVEELLLKIK